MGERVKTYAAFTVLLFGGGILFYLFFRYAFGLIAPFLLGYLIAVAAGRPAEALHRRYKRSEGLYRLMIALLFSVAAALFLFFSVKVLVGELGRFIEGLGAEMPASVETLLTSAPLLSAIWQDGKIFERVVDSLLSFLPSLLSGLVTLLPSLLFSIAVGAVASVYFCLDLERVHTAVKGVIPTTLRPALQKMREHLAVALLCLLRSNGILMLIAFALMLVGFLILRIPYPFLFSAVFALFDLLPVVGVGAFLVPMGIGKLLVGDVYKGVGILLLFALITVVRQLAEPRLLGARQGLHPLVTLFALYAGAKLFGAVGLLLFPVLALLLHSLFFSREKSEREKEKRRVG